MDAVDISTTASALNCASSTESRSPSIANEASRTTYIGGMGSPDLSRDMDPLKLEDATAQTVVNDISSLSLGKEDVNDTQVQDPVSVSDLSTSTHSTAGKSLYCCPIV